VKIEPHWGPVTGGAPIGLSVKITGTDFIKQTTAQVGGASPVVLVASRCKSRRRRSRCRSSPAPWMSS
jgi:hypothetical protein